MCKSLVASLFFLITFEFQAHQLKLFVPLGGISSSVFHLGEVAYDTYSFTATESDCNHLFYRGSGRILSELYKEVFAVNNCTIGSNDITMELVFTPLPIE